MPNWVYNSLVVEGSEESIVEFLGRITVPGSEDIEMFPSLLPIPPNVQSRADWCRDNYGTSKVDIDTEILDRSNGYVNLRFDTAWSAPILAFDKIAAMFPQLTFDLDYDEEFESFAGEAVWEDGTCSFKHEWDITEEENDEA